VLLQHRQAPPGVAISSAERATRGATASRTRAWVASSASSGRCSPWIGSASSPTWPISSTISSTRVTSSVPGVRSSTWQPTDIAEVTGPGTTMAERSSLRA